MNGLVCRIRKRLALYQALLVILMAMAIGTTLGLFRAGFEIHWKFKEIDRQMFQLCELTEQSATTILYEMNREFADRLIAGLLRTPSIRKVQLVDEMGGIFWEGENPPASGTLSPLVHRLVPRGGLYEKRLLSNQGGLEGLHVGQLRIETDAYRILQELVFRSGIRLLGDLLNYMVLGVFLAYLFIRTLTRPILDLTRDVAAINPAGPTMQGVHPPPQHRHNELGQLSGAINSILYQSHHLNRQLEQRVQERTAELNIERRQLLSIFDSIDEVIYVADPKTHRILYVNEAFKKIWGNGVGRRCHTLMHGRKTPCLQCNNAQIFGEHFGKTMTSVYRNHGNGKWFRALSRAIRWPDGRLVRYEMAIDISMEKQNEARLEERTRELERMNRELEGSITQLRSTQQQLIQSEKLASLGSLVAGVSHEINTPIGIARTAASHLEDRTRNLLGSPSGSPDCNGLARFKDVALEATTIISTNLARAARLVRSFKQIAVDQTHSQYRRFPLHAHIEETLFSLRPRLKSTRHTVRVDGPEEISILNDPGALSQITTNFVMNSLQHAFENEKEGEMRFAIRKRDDMVFIEYEDTGKGLDPEALRHIFDPFFTTRRGSGGTGLGMHIVYNLVTRTMKGEILCENADHGGFRAKVTLPVDATAQSLSAVPASVGFSGMATPNHQTHTENP